MQSVKGAQFLNVTFLPALFASSSAADVFGTFLIPLTSIQASL